MCSPVVTASKSAKKLSSSTIKKLLSNCSIRQCPVGRKKDGQDAYRRMRQDPCFPCEPMPRRAMRPGQSVCRRIHQDPCIPCDRIGLKAVAFSTGLSVLGFNNSDATLTLTLTASGSSPGMGNAHPVHSPQLFRLPWSHHYVPRMGRPHPVHSLCDSLPRIRNAHRVHRPGCKPRKITCSTL